MVAAALYTWRSATYLEGYYAASVRSMSASWHDFVFGAFDPAGTVTLDKLPGALWVQALSVRAVGVSTWAIVLPQAVEGVLAVLVLHRTVRRLAGPVAAILAAAVLALSPAAVTLDRGNIPDSLMILLLLLAADATVRAVTTDRWRHLLVAGVWVGLAFQAKMVEAWFVLPALVVVWLVAGHGRLARRVLQVSAVGAVTVVVSLSWMAAVTLTPASGRPYVDGSQDNSLFQQVFVYNGAGRLDQASPNQLLTRSIGLDIPPPPPVAWNRLLKGSFGRDIGWLVPAAFISLVAGLVAARRDDRRRLVRAGLALWGTWLVVFFIAFTVSSSVNSYYTAALAPPIAALFGTGAVLAWGHRRSVLARATVAVTVVATVGYAAWLLPGSGTGLPGWLAPAVLGLGAVAVAAVVTSTVSVGGRRLVVVGLVASGAAVLLAPTVGSATVASNRLGPFDTPFQPHAVTAGVRAFFGVFTATERLVPSLEQARRGAPYLMATQTSALAAPFIYVSGQEVLPIGGYTGTIPEPSLAELRSMVRTGDFHLVLQSPTTTDPRLVWIARNCLPVLPPAGVRTPRNARYAIHYCLPSS